ncbi:MAG: DUF5709 domain-containing protein [Frankiaceae bacterium]|nr:DUF5709 domain-containing protein [Frankiaceae bacterium]
MTESSAIDDGFGDTVYEAGDPDSDVFDPEDTLTGAGDLESFDEPAQTLYSPPDRQPRSTRWGTTAWEQQQGEPLDMRLAEEEPDITADDIALDEADPRAGRLVASELGDPGRESDTIARDVGRAGYAATAEEAAMHIVDEEALDPDPDRFDGLGDAALEDEDLLGAADDPDDDDGADLAEDERL